MIPNVPRIPTAAGKNLVTEVAAAGEGSQLLLDFAGSVDRRDCPRSLELVRKMQGLCMESERTATAGVLARAFDGLSSSTPRSCKSTGPAVHELQEEVLLLPTSILPLSGEARALLGSSPSVTSLVRMLKSSDLSARRNSVFVAKELALTSDHARAAALAKIEGLVDGLVKVVEQPIFCPSTTKAALVAIFYLISASKEETATASIKKGLLPSVLDLLVGWSERSVCEKALGVLDAICGSEQGREAASNHALTVPLLVKKILRVSDLATEFAVSALWKLVCKNSRGDEALCMECLQVGAFQKVLLLLQVGCGKETKEKATQLLKVLNVYRSKGECIETMDFKQLKRSF